MVYNMVVEELVRDFEIYLSRQVSNWGKPLSSKTIKAYCSDAGDFLTTFPKLGDVFPEHMGAYLEGITKKPETIVRKTVSLRRFASFCRDRGITFNVQQEHLVNMMREKYNQNGSSDSESNEVRAVNDKEFYAVVDALRNPLNKRSTQTPLTKARNVVATSLMYLAGAKIGEIVEMRDHQLVIEGPFDTIRADVEYGQNDARQVSFEFKRDKLPELIRYQETLRVGKLAANVSNNYLFLDGRMEPFDGGRVLTRILAVAAEEKGLKCVNPNSLRAGFAINLANKGLSNKQIASRMGLVLPDPKIAKVLGHGRVKSEAVRV